MGAYRVMLRFDVFGKLVGVEKAGGVWRAFYLGGEGKHRVAEDILIPPSVREEALAQYLADLCHEWATPEHPEVRPLAAC
jgi:hypothetical protein